MSGFSSSFFGDPKHREGKRRLPAIIIGALLLVLGFAGAATAADSPDVADLPELQPNDGALQDYCEANYPGTEGIIFSTGSATTNSLGELMKTEAGYTLTWVEDVGGATFEYDIAVMSIVEEGGDGTHLMFEFVVAFLGGNDENGYDYGGDPRTAVELLVPGATGQNITHFGFCAITTGEIIVIKQTLPDGDPTIFTFEASWDADGFTLGDGGQENSGRLDDGTYSVSETVPEGWALTSATCDDGTSTPDNIDLQIGETVTCTFTNTKDGRIEVEKQTLPDGDLGMFEFSGDIAVTLGDGGVAGSDVAPGSYSVSEVVPAGWDLTSIVCDDGNSSGDTGTATASFSVEPGETVRCVFTNTKRGMVELSKLVNGVVRDDISWTFTLEGPEVNTSTSVPPNPSDFDGAKLIPGETYTICERGVPVGYGNTWLVDGVDVTASVYDPAAADPDASNEDYCLDITVEPGQTLSIVVDNTLRGDQRTPGYWKNWNTCSPGNQSATAAKNGGVANGFYLLDDVLPITIGSLEVSDCEDGRDLLDRRDLKNGKKKANDAAYNLASHLLAAKANVAAGAGTCPALFDTIAAADALLASIGFDGTGNYLRPRNAEYQDALDLAAILDAYNNGELCPAG